MEKILISACLLGEKVRYDGRSVSIDSSKIQRWADEGRLISLCPEMEGGLPCPRPAAEIETGQGLAVLTAKARVINSEGLDVTASFIQGALRALERCREQGIKIAILKSNSPSCGNSQTYDGNFRGRRVQGSGVTAALLGCNGIAVFNEHQLAEVERLLKRGEASV